MRSAFVTLFNLIAVHADIVSLQSRKIKEKFAGCGRICDQVLYIHCLVGRDSLVPPGISASAVPCDGNYFTPSERPYKMSGMLLRLTESCGKVRLMNVAHRLFGLVAVVLIVLSCSSCRRNDFRVHKIRVPGLKNEKCVEIIQTALVRYTQQPSMDGSIKLDRISFDQSAQAVTIEYDSMKVALKNLEHAIAAAGFVANDIPADSNAMTRLPPECR